MNDLVFFALTCGVVNACATSTGLNIDVWVKYFFGAQAKTCILSDSVFHLQSGDSRCSSLIEIIGRFTDVN